MALDRWNLVKILTQLLFAVALISVSAARSNATTCPVNSVHGIAGKGQLVISEVAITRTFDACPTSDLGRDFKVTPGETVFVWLRLEGDLAFAQTARSSDLISVRLHRSKTLKENWKELAIANDRLGVAAIRQEAALPDSNGFFDWRLYTWVNAFAVPGKYEMSVSYGNRQVCQATGSCAVTFDVSEGR